MKDFSILMTPAEVPQYHETFIGNSNSLILTPKEVLVHFKACFNVYRFSRSICECIHESEAYTFFVLRGKFDHL